MPLFIGVISHHTAAQWWCWPILVWIRICVLSTSSTPISAAYNESRKRPAGVPLDLPDTLWHLPEFSSLEFFTGFLPSIFQQAFSPNSHFFLPFKISWVRTDIQALSGPWDQGDDWHKNCWRWSWLDRIRKLCLTESGYCFSSFKTCQTHMNRIWDLNCLIMIQCVTCVKTSNCTSSSIQNNNVLIK